MHPWLALPLAGCTPGLRGDGFATASATLAVTRAHDAVLAVNVDEGTVSRLDLRSGEVEDEVYVGVDPTRIARVGDDFWVTLRGERRVAVLREDDGRLALVGLVDAGAEPFGVVATEDGERVYVANALSATVVEHDGPSMQ